MCPLPQAWALDAAKEQNKQMEIPKIDYPSKQNGISGIFQLTSTSGVNPLDCTKCVRVFRQDHHPEKGERIMS